MPQAKGASFGDFVKDQREKKKNEVLAQEFLGRGRKPNTAGPGAGKARNVPEKPTLLSRMSGSAGVQKRSSSAKPSGSIDGKWQHDLHKLNNPNGPAAKGRGISRPASAQQLDRNTRTYDKFASALNRTTTEAPGFNIRGVANGGPYTVIASNFAPGTTAADIEAVMSPHAGETLGCRLISAAPTVMVELQCATKEGADNVIATFNNKKVRLASCSRCVHPRLTSKRRTVDSFTCTSRRRLHRMRLPIHGHRHRVSTSLSAMIWISIREQELAAAAVSKMVALDSARLHEESHQEDHADAIRLLLAAKYSFHVRYPLLRQTRLSLLSQRTSAHCGYQSIRAWRSLQYVVGVNIINIFPKMKGGFEYRITSYSELCHQRLNLRSYDGSEPWSIISISL